MEGSTKPMSFSKSLNLTLGLTLSLGLFSACPAQPAANSGTPPTASPSQSATPTTSPTPENPATPPPGSTEGPSSPGEIAPTPTARPTAFVLPANLSRIQFSAQNDRFLDQVGEQTQFQVELIDNLGQVIDAVVPLEWISSRPDDFSVDAEGHLTARVASGFSTITVRIPGTSFEARTIINVVSGGSSGGGGGGSSPRNTAPVITLLQASNQNVIGTGVLVRLTATATDAESNLGEASYSWSCAPNCTAQFNATQGTEVYWRTPSTGGTYTLALSVSDDTASTQQTLEIEVQTGQGQLQINPVP